MRIEKPMQFGKQWAICFPVVLLVVQIQDKCICELLLQMLNDFGSELRFNGLHSSSSFLESPKRTYTLIDQKHEVFHPLARNQAPAILSVAHAVFRTCQVP